MSHKTHEFCLSGAQTTDGLHPNPKNSILLYLFKYFLILICLFKNCKINLNSGIKEHEYITIVILDEVYLPVYVRIIELNTKI